MRRLTFAFAAVLAALSSPGSASAGQCDTMMAPAGQSDCPGGCVFVEYGESRACVPERIAQCPLGPGFCGDDAPGAGGACPAGPSATASCGQGELMIRPRERSLLESLGLERLFSPPPRRQDPPQAPRAAE